MCSPKLSDSLIPVLYRLGKSRRMPMTKLVHLLIVKALSIEELPEELVSMLQNM